MMLTTLSPPRRALRIGSACLLQRLTDVPEGDAWLAPEERATLAALQVEKRRTEWRLGRWTAKRLLDARLIDAPEPDAMRVQPASDGAPEVWCEDAPLPLVLSISHSAGLAFCAVAPHGRAIGCDIELVEPRSPALAADYFTATECGVVERAAPEERARLVTLIWSAKESALKALRTGLRADTRSVEVGILRGAAVCGWSPLAVRDARRVRRGWWRLEGSHLLTVVGDALEEPPMMEGRGTGD